MMCFGCLERRINADLSDEVTFCYGLSHLPLPIGSSAVVQVSSSEAGEKSNQFMVVYLPSDRYASLTQFVNECLPQDQTGSEGCVNNEFSPVDGDRLDFDGGAELDTLSNETSRLGSRGSDLDYSGRFSYTRIISSLAPLAQCGICSPSIFKEIVNNFSSGSSEDQILQSLDNLITGKTTRVDSINFLSLIGIPSFNESSFPGCLRHPNIAPCLGILKTAGYVNIVLPMTQYTLENVLHFSPDALKSDWHIRFLVYQLLSALAYMHGLGVAHGNLCPSSVMLTKSCWVWLQIFDKSQSVKEITNKECIYPQMQELSCSLDNCASQGVYADLKLCTSEDWQAAFHFWWKGEMSNFEYLLILNKLAGRRWGDHTFHPVMPWVIDFSTKPDEDSDAGWRDLSKSKWRLAKGDEQLDFTYLTSEIPHHVSDECLSELAVCSYKARRLPLHVLRLAVRSVYEPNEYPSTMQRLYQWTPDECIPEFYCDPDVFLSLHSGMADLAVPQWASGPKEFIKLHREALESKRVSSEIHHWIDITFGYKMSGQAAVSAKNVMLHSADSKCPQSEGRRQLFTLPHPVRRGATGASPVEYHYLGELEEASIFAEHASHLAPIYLYHSENSDRAISSTSTPEVKNSMSDAPCQSYYGYNHESPSDMNLSYLLEYFENEDDSSSGYQDYILWKQKSSHSTTFSEKTAVDIFSIGCILAELYLRRPLFDKNSLTTYLERGVLPTLMYKLPYHIEPLVEACITKDWSRRPSVKCLLESPYFTNTVRSSYLFLAPLQLLATDGSRLQYAANFVKKGALKAMGTFSAEMCAPYCLSLVVNSLSDTEAECAYIILEEFLKYLEPKAVTALMLPVIQKILQATGYSRLKVSLLQESFVRGIWNKIGKQAYLETLHPMVISNLVLSRHKSSEAAASVLLIGSSEELGVPITVNQTIVPLIQCFGKGLCSDGIDVLVRIGGSFGENFIVKQILPLVKSVMTACINTASKQTTEPVQSWSSLALLDSLMCLDGLMGFLPGELIVKELIEDGNFPHGTILMQSISDIVVLQVAGTSLINLCYRIGSDLTALHVMPKLKELFDQLAFPQGVAGATTSNGRNVNVSKPLGDSEAQFESRIDLILLLYPSYAALLGIEKLRQCCSTWLLFEQYLLRTHNWKWEHTADAARGDFEIGQSRRPLFSKASTDYSPAKLLLNGVGWSVPQSQGTRGVKTLMPPKRAPNSQNNGVGRQDSIKHNEKREPWFYFPTVAVSWDGLEFPGRAGNMKDELPWKIRASVLHSARAHHGALRSLAVCQDECIIFTAGVGPGFKGTVQKWDLTGVDCVSGYYGHEEVVNDMRVLSYSGRVASCDGTIHIWNSQTGKLITVFAEPSAESAYFPSPLSAEMKDSNEAVNMMNSNSLSSGILANAFDGSLYTSMHLLESSNKLVVGTGNGSLRFIDVVSGEKLHLWRCESLRSGFPSLVSSICSFESDNIQAAESGQSSWMAAGFSSGNCKLIDARSGNVIATWRAHDAFVTKLAAPQDHLLVSSSLDKTLRVWDLRRDWSSNLSVFRGHSDGVTGFCIWGQNVISIARNKIGVASLSKTADEVSTQTPL
uniref:BEACH domain-containing protein n=1 Tax=Kalanchoe fedtschenkoi TaxID=63787 RepID=A0A7N0UW20_KALFE